MPYLPIAESGIPFQFGSTAGISMIGSVVSGTNVDAGSFDLTLIQNPSATFRVTCLNYVLSAVPTVVATFSTVDDGDSQETANTGGLVTFAPSPFITESFIESGEAYLTYTGANAVATLEETFAFLFEVWIDETPTLKKGIGRTFTGIVSAYSAAQVQPRRVRRFQQRRLVANFNGAILKDQLITHVRWDCTSPWAIYMSDPGIYEGQKEVGVTVNFNFSGWGAVKATVTLDDGSIENYEFYFTVQDAPLYPQAVYNTANGPYVLEATWT